MSRAQRLLDLIQVLRRHRFPVAGTALADEIGVSLRTVYRDIDTLRAQGAHIEGEAGVGYVLQPGFMLPPLMLSEEEIEALVLGVRWVAERTDAPLGKAARNALAKIGEVLPDDLKATLDTSALLIVPGHKIAGAVDLSRVRAAIKAECKVRITYIDAADVSTQRTIWPFALGFFEQTRMVVAWCETRGAYRHFRADRIQAMVPGKTKYPRRRLAMLKEWRAEMDARKAEAVSDV